VDAGCPGADGDKKALWEPSQRAVGRVFQMWKAFSWLPIIYKRLSGIKVGKTSGLQSQFGEGRPVTTFHHGRWLGWDEVAKTEVSVIWS
jgi:hypothetical protein